VDYSVDVSIMAAEETEPTWGNRALAVAFQAISAISRVDVDIAPRTRLQGDAGYAELDSFLPPPTVRRWTSPLPARGVKCVVKTFDQPGRWMPHEQLRELHSQLREVAKDSMDAIPNHYLLKEENCRAALSNRVVSVAFLEGTSTAIAFTAMVYLPYEGDIILHLGLTMISKQYRGRRIQSPLFSRCLMVPMYNLFRTTYTISNIAASPAGLGACSDYFCDVFPNYNTPNEAPSEYHLAVARHVLQNFRHEFACSAQAHFDERTFVVRGSNDAEGGGAPEFIKEDGKPVSKYKRTACNVFCSKLLDLSNGDELFQVGQVDIVMSPIKYLFSPTESDARNKKMH
jgi:hypothetical protein